MNNRILRVAAGLQIPITLGRVPGGLLFWGSSGAPACRVSGGAMKYELAINLTTAQALRLTIPQPLFQADEVIR
jgi:hypothetical protein